MGKSNFADEFLSSYPFVRISYKNTHMHTHAHDNPIFSLACLCTTHIRVCVHREAERELKEMCCRSPCTLYFILFFTNVLSPPAIKYIRCRSHERTTTNRNNRTSSPRCTLYYLFIIIIIIFFIYYIIYFTTPRYKNKAIKDRRRRRRRRRSPVLIINRSRVYLFCHNTLA